MRFTTGQTQLNEADRLEALTAATNHQDERSDWILEHWPHVVEHAELVALTEHAGALDHWPNPLPAAAQDLYNQLVSTSADATEPRHLHHLDHARMQANPLRRADVHENERDANYDKIEELQAVTDPAGTDLARQHIERLRERNSELRALINEVETMQRFIDWGDSPSPQLDDAINRRATHLAHTAITQHDAWVGQLVLESHRANPDIGINHLRRLVNETAAYRERADVTGTDPIGPTPEHHPELLVTYHQINTQLDPEMPTAIELSQVEIDPF